MDISLKTLLNIAPFPAEKRDKILAIYDGLTEDQKIRLSDAAWIGISTQYFSRLKYEFDKLNLEVSEGKREYRPNDFEEVRARLTHEFAQKLQAAETQESIEEVKQQLEKYKTQPMPQDQTVGTPPPQKP